MAKSYIAISAIIFAVVAIGHLVRIVQGWQVQLGDIEITVRKLCAKGGGMIERNRTWPAVNERTGVEIFDAADAERFQRERWLVCDDKSGRKSRAHASSVCTRRHLANARLRRRMPSKARKMRALPIYAQASSAASAADAGFSPFRAEADK